MSYECELVTAPSGWVCPICHRVYSPSTFTCYYCGDRETTVATNTEYETKKAEFVRKMMVGYTEKCRCYHTEYGKPQCWGTKEREECSCDGDKNKCNFYEWKLTWQSFRRNNDGSD